MSTVAAGKVISIHYTLRDDDGDVIDRSGDEPLEYLHGAGNIVEGLEKALDGKAIGDAVKVSVPPDEGYGERDDAAVKIVPRSAFPKEIELEEGMELGMEDGDGNALPIWVTKIAGDKVTIDLNHPLAGATLHFEVKVAGLRAATAEEVEHGHPHGPHGHDH